MEKCILLGNGAREAVIAEKISEGFELYCIMPYENPTISEYVKNSNGEILIGDPFDKELVKKFIKEKNITNCVISSDNLLKEGLIDLARELELKTFGPTSLGSKIEWSKTYALDIVQKIAPEMVIKNFEVRSKEELRQVIDKNYTDDGFVIKPEGLTGGKGVKVGGLHFKGKEEGYAYALSCLEDSEVVIVQDKVEGKEFTVTGLTDGKNIVITPTTFDYPYRFDEDKGPGTGGMGCLSFETGLLPFLNKDDINKCAELMKNVIQYINKDKNEFTGPIYGGFFKCDNGIKFIEFNARFGDPEALNILNTLETPFKEVFDNIQKQQLSSENCKFEKKAICTVYMVSPNYAISSSKEPCKYILNKSKINQNDAKVYFASSKKIDENSYESVGNSRLVAIVAKDETLEKAKRKVYNAIEGNVDKILNYRKDIGTIYIH